MTGGYNNVGFVVWDAVVQIGSEVVGPVLETYRVPAVLLGLAIFSVTWLLVSRWLKG